VLATSTALPELLIARVLNGLSIGAVAATATAWLGELHAIHRPDASSRWCCHPHETPEPFFPGCGTVWNTFSTRGRCPGCDHQWLWTSCLSCGEWSLHQDWYEYETGHPGR